MRIDFQHHILPNSYLDAVVRLGIDVRLARLQRYFRAPISAKLLDQYDNVSLRLKDMDKSGVDIGVLSIPPGTVDAWEVDQAVEGARSMNDSIGKVCQKHPDRFVGLCVLPLQDIPTAIDELDRCIRELGLNGVGIGSKIGRKFVDDLSLEPFYERMQHYDLPIYIHPTGFGDAYDDGSGELWDNYSGNLLYGWPFNTTIAVQRLVFGGVLERFPNLKFVASHLGGMITFYPERFETHLPTFLGHLTQVPKPVLNNPHAYVKKIFLDTAVYNEPALNCAYSYAGPDRLVFATDYPFGPDLGTAFMRTAVKVVEGLKIKDEDREKIMWKNAKRLLKLN